MAARGLVGALVASVLLAGCGSVQVLAPAVPALPVADGVPGVPGWHTNLASTTCADFSRSMTAVQQVGAAQWFLAIERRVEVTDASDGAEFAGTFASEIGAACTKYYGSDPTTSVLAAASLAYMNDPGLHPAHH